MSNTISHSLPNAPRSRRAKVRERITRSIRQHLSAVPRAVILRADDYFEAVLASECRTPPPTLATVQFILHGAPLTVVGVPDRVWANATSMAPIKQAAKRAEKFGRVCILLPHSGIDAIAGLRPEHPVAGLATTISGA